MAGQEFIREIPVEFPESQPQHDVLKTLWARTRIDDLMSQDFNGLQGGIMKPELKETITQLGLEYQLMTQFTSFVAVEEMTVTEGGQPRRIDVPVEMPEGVSYEGVFGSKDEANKAGMIGMISFGGISHSRLSARKSPAIISPKAARVESAGGSIGKGSGVGVGPGRGGNTGGGDMPLDGRSQETRDRAGASPEMSAEALRRLELLRSKVHPAIFVVIERLKKNRSVVSAAETKFVHDGKAEIQVWTTNKSPENIKQLEGLGFEVILDHSSKLIIGRLPVEKLEALAELAVVKYVAPQMK